MECVIYDFETLGQHQQTSAIASFAILQFSEKQFTIGAGYSYEELLQNCKYIKFNVKDQIDNYGRKLNKATLEWWDQQGPEARKQIAPSGADLPISALYAFLQDNVENVAKVKKAYCRGNTFDAMVLQYLLEDCGHDIPWHWGSTRDTRSMIDGMSFGMGIRNDYMPDGIVDKFVKHDPRHDIALDVMRMQFLARAILLAD